MTLWIGGVQPWRRAGLLWSAMLLAIACAACGGDPVPSGAGSDLGVPGDMAGFAPTGVQCGAVQCKADEFCIKATSGAPGGGVIGPLCQTVPECATNPTCECFDTAQDSCHGWSQGICFVQWDGIVWCQSL